MTRSETAPNDRVSRRIEAIQDIVRTTDTRPRYGRITNLASTLVRARVTGQHVGHCCILRDTTADVHCFAEVVGVNNDETLLLPLQPIDGLSSESIVIPTNKPFAISVGTSLEGRILDARAQPLDGKDLPADLKAVSVATPSYPAMDRPVIDTPFQTGIRAIDGALTLGVGQRIGIAGPAGSGKSSLLSAIIQNAKFDIAVVALIGERGRELRDFLENTLDAAQRERCVFIVSTSDESPGTRVLGARSAVRLAEAFADEGKSVLLLFDSLTRYARAKRDIGLMLGEPPTRRGFTPESLSSMAELVEKCGRRKEGSITALFTILTEGDRDDDPVREEALSLLDGHVELSAKLAEKGHYPAIDVLRSKSRLLGAVAPREAVDATLQLRKLLQDYEEIEMLVQIGEYQEGEDADADRAVQKRKEIDEFLQQDLNDRGARISVVQRKLRELVE